MDLEKDGENQLEGQEDKRGNFTHGPRKQKDLTQYDIICLLWHDGILRDILEGTTSGKNTRGRRQIQLVNDLLETNNYADLKKAAEERSVWRTIKRQSHTCSVSRSLERQRERE